MELGRIAIWTSDLHQQPASVVREAVAELEGLGFSALWVSEPPVGREAFSQAALLLAATRRLVIGLGVANIWARDATAAALGQRTLEEAWPHRFILGLGVSHQSLVNSRGHDYVTPVRSMAEYLDRMDRTPVERMPAPEVVAPRVLGALGPRMLELARDRTDGAHPFFVPPEHTAATRALLGPQKLLVPQQAVILGAPDDREVVELAREQIEFRVGLPNYRRNLERLGFTSEDFDGGGSDRLRERVIVIGDEDAIAARVKEHVDAGADQVALHVLSRPGSLPLGPWRRLAALLG
jgi:probable F420-dependent oxidoreductase